MLDDIYSFLNRRYQALKVIDIREGVSIPFFAGVTGRILLSSDRLMFFLVELDVGNMVPEHRHPHEQMGLCLEGKAEFKVEGKNLIIKKGMAYFIKSNEKHSVKVLGKKKGIFLDVFSPPREDYLAKMGSSAHLCE